MATDSEIKSAYQQLRPYFDGQVSSGDLLALDDGVAAGESQLALGWLIAYLGVDGIHVTIPKDLFLDAFNLLSDDDKQEYDPILQNMMKAGQLVS